MELFLSKSSSSSRDIEEGPGRSFFILVLLLAPVPTA
jgi:hypothetical protein